ncbi:FG-GAP repeat domain-containing protein [Croceivirga sp. JEA036]|uniref:FG-GAP repeat domain-containing protein n=1 Tax=Croceivirga sp. JEA036 TaxID=2721162 RepID=UPI00143A567B|nr:VCBS repeat-containing protein [Croceivirga sp. JEA036]NJB36737.1 VCBS repeat-containing protein [Croceivirga sp. JEA036]
MSRLLLLSFLIVLFTSCNKEENQNHTKGDSLFILKDSNVTGIYFNNKLTYTEDFNPYLYRNFYNGGGVAIGDINNDGLNDIYFTGNQVGNKLYLNKGNFTFQDITLKAGVACNNIWSTGATIVDVNGDGLQDIYVCKAGPPGGTNRANELFINQGDLTFKEEAKKYGLAVKGLSVQASFFDYDKDGDLDCYLLNNSLKAVGGFDLIKDQRTIPDITGNGNKFFINDGGKFIEASEKVGIYTSNIGFGLGITLGDFNDDHWTDIFISNDFFERDYLYINKQDGTFSEQLETYFSSISMGSMGADLADLNNDLKPELVVTEMLPLTEERRKTKTIYENWDKQQLAVKKGYFNQFSRNTLQTNLGNKNYVDISRATGIAATEWSWSALFFDADNDGLKDVFISNGIYKDLLDRDYLSFEANDQAISEKIRNKEPDVIKKLIDAMPSQAVPNQMFQNNGGLNFTSVNTKWGLDKPSFSNGSVYSDLDNDGDLDLVVNNVNMPSFVYENTSKNHNNTLRLSLKQNGDNNQAIGAQFYFRKNGTTIKLEDNYITKGFQSSISSTILVSTKKEELADSLYIVWPNNDLTAHALNWDLKQLTIQKEQHTILDINKLPPTNKERILIPADSLFAFKHKENVFSDFNKERLLPQMYSNEGPGVATADLNQDGITDVFVGGAKFQSSSLFLSNGAKDFLENTTFFESDIRSEVTKAIFIDADNDGDQDLYVGHGGKAFANQATELDDVLYLNDKNSFTKSKLQPKFPKKINTGAIAKGDIDNDGDIDLVVGERFITATYGLPGSIYILRNNGNGQFTVESPKELKDIGMITSLLLQDINDDQKLDIVAAGEWMSPKIFLYANEFYKDATSTYGLAKQNGLWTSLFLQDVDKDGDLDLLAGNIGTNNFFSNDMKMYVGDFDHNGFVEQIICKELNGLYFPIVDKDELIAQIPSLKKKFVYYKDYANTDISQFFSPEVLKNARNLSLTTLESTLFINDGDKFTAQTLPQPLQLSPIYTIKAIDIDEDGEKDLIFGGNQFLVKPQFGSYDASRGWVIFGTKNGNLDGKPISLQIKGQIRDFAWIKNRLTVFLNNQKVMFYDVKK